MPKAPASKTATPATITTVEVASAVAVSSNRNRLILSMVLPSSEALLVYSYCVIAGNGFEYESQPPPLTTQAELDLGI
jgi:hypothetical protein